MARTHSRPVRATTLRADLYGILDRVLETGEPALVERKGKQLLIVPAAPASKLSRLEKRPGFITGDPRDLVHLDWSSEWRP